MIKIISKSLILLLFLLNSNLLHAQNPQNQWTVAWKNSEKNSLFLYTSKYLADSAITQTLLKLQAEGFINAQIDTSIFQTTIECRVTRGSQFRFKNSFVSISPNILDKKGYNKYQPLNQFIVADYPSKLIVDYENNGYPFANCQLDSLHQNGDDFDAYWTLSKGPYIEIDSVIIQSPEKLPEQFILNYIGIKKGQAYNEESIANISKRLKELNFLEKKGNVEIIFRREGAKIFIPLVRKKANFFNAVIGVRPNDITGQINITGDVEVKLKSALNKGEDIYLNWRRLQPQTQNLNISTEIPYLFKTPIGIEGDITIYRRDSTFSSTSLKGGAFIYFSASSKLGIYLEQRQTTSINSLSAAAPFGGASGKFYGISYQNLKLDYRFNPRKGYIVDTDISVGNRQQTASESGITPKNQQVYRFEGQFAVFVPTFKNQTIKTSLNASIIDGSGLFANELYRIGGLRTIRGIDEESIFAQKWYVASFEYRFLPEQNTSFYAFVDQAWYVNYRENAAKDQPLGFGLGLNFQTKSGIFTFNYALGQQFNNPILVRNAKISFGFQNIF